MNELSRKKKYFEALKNLDILKIESNFEVIKSEEEKEDSRVVFKIKISLKDGLEVSSHGEAELKSKNAFRLAETRAFLRALEIIYALKGLSFKVKEEKQKSAENRGPSKKQIGYLKHLAKSLGKDLKDEEIKNLNEKEVRVLIEKYKKELEEKK